MEERRISYGLVRDKNGKPRIDDPDNLPQPIKDMLTDDDLRKLEPDVVGRLGMSHRLKG